MEERKQKEIDFHNALRDDTLKKDPAEFRRLTANRKYYAAAAKSIDEYRALLARYCSDGTVLDYGCGDAEYSTFLARSGARRVEGIDISDVSVENSRRLVATQGLGDRVFFRVMDGESLDFESDSFDLVCEAGVLHHLDLEKAISEISRVVKSDGRAICYETLGHNWFIHLYRRLTPHLRTEYETQHILRVDDFRMMRKYFASIEVRFYHLTVLATVPFRRLSGFNALRAFFDAVDSVLLRIPFLRRQAWMMIFVLSGPIREKGASAP